MKLIAGKRETERTRRAQRRALHRYQRHAVKRALLAILLGINDPMETEITA